MAVRFVVILIFAIIMTVFAVQNSGVVPITVFFAEFQISQALVILVSMLAGAVIGLLLSMFKQFKTARQLKGLRKSLTLLEEENKGLLARLTAEAQPVPSEGTPPVKEPVLADQGVETTETAGAGEETEK